MNPEQNHTISQVGGNTTPEPVSKTTQTSAAPIVGYNMRCPAVKRLMREAAELSTPDEDFAAHPTDGNLFEWHFTIRGPEESDFQAGVYHGRIIFPSEYPMKPPSFILLTPNGRFQTEEKICLSISNYHPETWLPSWSIRTALVALRSFMATPGNEGAIGSLNFAPEERRKLAVKSRAWECHECGPIIKMLPVPVKKEGDIKAIVNVGEGDASQSQHSVAPTKPAFQAQPEIPDDKCNEKENANAETVAPESENASSGNNEEVASGSAPTVNAVEEDASRQVDQRQPHEPIKNILYDFGIGCFIVLILALCLRRLLGFFVGTRL